MRAALAGLALAVPGLLGLTACGAPSPADQLRQDVDSVTRAANDRDAAQLRESADALADEVRAQREDRAIGAGEADRLLALAAELREQADLVDAELLRRRAEQAEQRAEQEAAARAAEKAAAEKAAAQQAAAEQAAAEEAARRGRGKAPEGDAEQDDDKGKDKGEDD